MAPTNNPAPTTNYNTAYQEVGAAYDLPTKQIQQAQDQALQAKNTSLSQLAQDETTNLSSLDQAKVNAFKNIGETANSRNMLFSGYSPYQQNQYVTNTYNPNLNKINTSYDRGVQSTNTRYDTTMTSLKDKLDSLNQQRANDAEKLVLDTQASYAKAAGSGGGGSGGSGSTTRVGGSSSVLGSSGGGGTFTGTPTPQKVTAALRSVLQSRNLVGGDGHVAPSTLAAMYNSWMSYGLTDKSFWTAFQGLWNPNEGNYKQLFNAAKNAR